MTDDEFNRIKDAEKQHLRAKRTLRRLQNALREQKEAGRGTVARMTERIQALFNDHRSALDALQWDTARLEARLDALRDTLTGASADTDARNSDPRESDGPGDDDVSDDEATLRMHRAERLVDDLRTQLDTDAPDAPRDSSSSTNDSSESAPPDDGLPEKTIGRVPRS
ncbi:hypothetical protein CRI93_10255 [Longimonas halophila]|uniref:Uncharacterized protein n=1 Tax=Longimonas halophila TaxID=1469170 RepID=A0A2H3NMX4_9BACT|nr:hypothetical protein [Longimonas halophila]PEN06200.1 hypothetical protein CRI93_10255 [Longimonas halophila]